VRALLVSYVFPPVGGAGVQRVTKWVRHLPEAGITPVVLTASNPSVPVRDPSLLSDIDPSIRIERASTLEPSYATKRRLGSAPTGRRRGGALGGAMRHALFPDPQVLWLPGAIARLAQLRRERPRIDVAVITAPPFSSFMLLPWIERLLEVPVVLDYRDEWATTLRAGHDHAASALSCRVSALVERALALRAAAITTATEEFRDELLARLLGVDPRRVIFLPNGFDPDDLPPRGRQPDTRRFVMTYAGTVFRLTSLRGLLGALALAKAQRPELFSDFELRVYGRVAPAEADAFAGTEPLGVKLMGYVGHREALDALSRSHVNVCALDDVEGAERVYPAKIFELMALERRCLVLAPPGALERLVKKHDAGDVTAPRDVEGIARLLVTYLEAFRRGSFAWATRPRNIHRFSRRALADELGIVLRTVTEEASMRERRLYLTSAEHA
jgi:glycosyltransferase involved in cell wall biosynthesis